MKEMSAFHRQHGPDKPLSHFYRTRGCKDMVEALKGRGLVMEDILRTTKSHRGAGSEAWMHPLMVLAYLQWADYAMYVSALVRKFGDE